MVKYEELFEPSTGEWIHRPVNSPDWQKGPAPTTTFEDWSQVNPGLHRLYVSWAMQHLEALNEMIEKLGEKSHIDWADAAMSLWQHRRQLIITKAHYRDAAAFLMAGYDAQDAAADE